MGPRWDRESEFLLVTKNNPIARETESEFLLVTGTRV